MVEGFQIELTADELVRHLDDRVRHHEDRAAECEAERTRFEAGGPVAADSGRTLAVYWIGSGDELAELAVRHKRRAATLAFLRDHVIAHEIYRLGIGDLRELGLWRVARGRRRA